MIPCDEHGAAQRRCGIVRSQERCTYILWRAALRQRLGLVTVPEDVHAPRCESCVGASATASPTNLHCEVSRRRVHGHVQMRMQMRVRVRVLVCS